MILRCCCFIAASGDRLAASSCEATCRVVWSMRFGLPVALSQHAVSGSPSGALLPIPIPPSTAGRACSRSTLSTRRVRHTLGCRRPLVSLGPHLSGTYSARAPSTSRGFQAGGGTSARGAAAAPVVRARTQPAWCAFARSRVTLQACSKTSARTAHQPAPRAELPRRRGARLGVRAAGGHGTWQGAAGLGAGNLKGCSWAPCVVCVCLCGAANVRRYM